MTSATWRRSLEKLCAELGWTLELTTKHIKLTRPGTRAVFCASSPSRDRALPATRTRMIRHMKETAQ